jgi:hypothetical protein
MVKIKNLFFICEFEEKGKKSAAYFYYYASEGVQGIVHKYGPYIKVLNG